MLQWGKGCCMAVERWLLMWVGDGVVDGGEGMQGCGVGNGGRRMGGIVEGVHGGDGSILHQAQEAV